MLGISKRGNRYVRRLLIHGSRSCVVHLDRTRDCLGAWIVKLQSRMRQQGYCCTCSKDCSSIGRGPSTNAVTRPLPDGSRLRLRGSRRMTRQSIGAS
jgi:hypothetical protein